MTVIPNDNVTDGANVYSVSMDVLNEHNPINGNQQPAQSEQGGQDTQTVPQQETQQAQPQTYNVEDEIVLTDDNGNQVTATVTNIDADGTYTLSADSPINGKRVLTMSADEIASRQQASQPQTEEETAPQVEQKTQFQEQTEQGQQQSVQTEQQGEQDYETMQPEQAYDKLVADMGGATIAVPIATAQMEQAKAELDKLQKKAPKLSGTPAEMKQALSEHNAKIAEAQRKLDAWTAINAVPQQRRAEEQKRIREENDRKQAEASVKAVAELEEQKKQEAEKQAEQDYRNEQGNGAVKESLKRVLSASSLKWSKEKAKNGEPFLIGENGNINLVDIPQEVFDKIGIKKSPFRLTPSMVAHVLERHDKELKLSSPEDAVNAILMVMNNFDHVRKGENNTFIFSVEGSRTKSARRAVAFELEYDKGQWIGIKTLGYDKVSNLKELTSLWEKGENNTSATGVATANVSSDQPLLGNQTDGIASNQKDVNSDSKDSELSQKSKEDAGEKEENRLNKLKEIFDKVAKGDNVNYEDLVSELPSLTDEEVYTLYAYGSNDKARSKVAKINHNALLNQVRYEANERQARNNPKRAFDKGYKFGLEIAVKIKNSPNADFDGYIESKKSSVERLVSQGYTGHAEITRGLIQAVVDYKASLMGNAEENAEDKEQQAPDTEKQSDAVEQKDSPTVSIKEIVQRFKKLEKERKELFEKDAFSEQYDEIIFKLKEFLESLTDEQLSKLGEKVGYSLYISDELKRRKKKAEEERFKGAFDTAMQSQGEVERKTDKKKVKVADYVSKDPERVTFTGVYHGEDGYAVATDTFTLVGSKKEFDKKQKGKIIGKDGKEIKDRKYPDYNKLKPKAENLHDSGIDTSDLRAFINGVKDRLKKEGRKPKEIEKAVIAVRSADGMIYYARIPTLEPFVKFCDENGLKIKNVFKGPNTNKYVTNFLYAEGNDAFALSIGVGDGKYLDYYPNDAWVYYNEGFQFAYDAMQKPRLEKADSKATEVSSTDALLRDALVRILRKMGIKVITDNKKAQRVLDRENGRVKAMSFGERYDYKQYPNGRIEPNLSNKEVRIKKAVLNHGFSNFDEAKEWAKKNIVRTLNNNESGGKGNVRISGTAVNKYLSESAVAKSDSTEVHLAVLKVLPDVIKESIDVETTPDFEKDENGVRKPGNKINKDVLIHRCYGAVEIDGKIYRVKITLKEYKDAVRDNKAYSYEATKIELLAGTLVGENNSSNPGTNNSISIANLLKDIEMTYNPGVKVLEESRKRTDRLREQRVWHGTGSDFEAFDHSYMGTGEGQQVFGWGTYVTEVEGIGIGYAKNYPKKVLTFKGLPITEMITLQDGRMVSSPERAAYDAIMQEGTVSKAKRFISRIKDMAEEEILRNLWDDVLNVLSNCKKSDFKQVAQRILYSVEIPDDNGTNYLHWEKPLTEEFRKRITEEAEKRGLAVLDSYKGKTAKELQANGELVIRVDSKFNGEDLYESLKSTLGSDKLASEFLSSVGITGVSYPAEYLSGGREDGARNYVIFNESDAKIVDKVRFFRTANGEAYGFTVDGKIYLDPTIAGAETAIHEYTHLWATALKNANPKEWSNIVSLMKDTPLWEKVASEYPELTTDDELADEVLAHYSGKRGAERLRKEAESIANGKGTLLDKAGAISALERVKEALTRFWKATADLLHIHFTTAEEVADKVLADLLNGVNPNEVAREYRRKQKQLERINETNPMLDNYHVGIRGLSDILTMREAIEEARQEAEEGDYETLSAYPDITNEMLENALQSGKITVYSSKPIKDGNFVTPSRMQAEDYAGDGMVYSKTVSIDDVAWINTDEGQFVKNRKDKAEKAPLRFQLIEEQGAEESTSGEDTKNPTWEEITDALESTSTSHTEVPGFKMHSSKSDTAKIHNNEAIAKDLEKLGESFNNNYAFSAKEFIGQLALRFNIPANSENTSYKQIQTPNGKITVRLSNHQGNAINFILKNSNNQNNYGIVIKLAKTPFKEEEKVNYLELVYFGDIVSGNSELQKAITLGLSDFVRTGSIKYMPKPNLLNASGSFKKKMKEFGINRKLEYDDGFLYRTSEKTGQSSPTAIADSVRSLAERLHLDNVEIVTDASALSGKEAKAKGFYSKSTGKITIVVPNNTSAEDAVQTLLHEAVAHYGMGKIMVVLNVNKCLFIIVFLCALLYFINSNTFLFTFLSISKQKYLNFEKI